MPTQFLPAQMAHDYTLRSRCTVTARYVSFPPRSEAGTHSLDCQMSVAAGAFHERCAGVSCAFLAVPPNVWEQPAGVVYLFR